MAVIKDALSTLPAKPAVMIAPIIVVAVLAMYYWDLHARCTEIGRYRDSLFDALQNLDSGQRFRLADFTEFDWNKVRVVARVEPGTIEDECPAGWNWARAERETLLASGNLTALIFGHDGKVVGYFELRRDRVAFPDSAEQLTPESAVFSVGREGQAVVLSRPDQET